MEGVEVGLFKCPKKDDPLEAELFPEEIEALKEFKKRKITRYYSDRFLMMTLFNKKFDLDRQITQLSNFGLMDLP